MRTGAWVLLALISMSTAGSAEEMLKEISWKEMQSQGRLLGGNLDGDDLVLEQTEPLPLSAQILVLEKPPITSAQYALTGEVSCEGVEGQGYLEMWNYFPGGGAYFSRTLAESGPMGALKGTANRRLFQLPFYNNAGGPPPERLELNVVLPGKGKVRIGPLKLVQFTGAARQPVRWLGVGALFVFVVAAAGVSIGWAARQRRKMELRRMQSLDAGR